MISLMVNSTAHFCHSGGKLYAMDLTYRSFPARYLGAFDRVCVVARSAEVVAPPEGWHEVTGPRVDFVPLPDYLGPWQFLKARNRLGRLIDEAVDQCDAFVLRVPCDLGTLTWRRLRRRNRPYFVEVLGDPWMSLAPGNVKSIVRPIARRTHRWALKGICREASGALYVTRQYLQDRYPPAQNVPTVACSDVELTEEMFVPDLDARLHRIGTLESRLASRVSTPVRLGFIGTFNTMYKRPDVHIRAAADLISGGLNLELAMVGSGTFLPRMRQLAGELGIGDRVNFHGRLPAGVPIARFLDGADLFLIASQTEGMPRALLEAMARGCPAIASRVGGIPELLTDHFLVPPGDAPTLALRIRELLADPQRMRQSARANLELAREFSNDILCQNRESFYSTLRSRLEPPSAPNAQTRGHVRLKET